MAAPVRKDDFSNGIDPDYKEHGTIIVSKGSLKDTLQREAAKHLQRVIQRSGKLISSDRIGKTNLPNQNSISQEREVTWINFDEFADLSNEQLCNDTTFLYQILNRMGAAYLLLPLEKQKKPHLALEAVKNGCPLSRIHPIHYLRKPIIIESFKAGTGSLKTVAKLYGDDDEIIDVALPRNGEDIQYASERIRNNKFKMALAIRNTEYAILHAGNTLKPNDEEIVELACINWRIIPLIRPEWFINNPKRIGEIISSVPKNEWEEFLKLLPSEDEAYMLEVAKIGWKILPFLCPNWGDDEKRIQQILDGKTEDEQLQIVKSGWIHWELIPELFPQWIQDENMLEDILGHYPEIYQRLEERFLSDSDLFVIAFQGRFEIALLYTQVDLSKHLDMIKEKLRCDEDSKLILKLISLIGVKALDLALLEDLKDPRFIHRAIDKGRTINIEPAEIFKKADASLKKGYANALRFLSVSGNLLQYFEDSVQEELQLVIVATKNCPRAVQYAKLTLDAMKRLYDEVPEVDPYLTPDQRQALGFVSSESIDTAVLIESFEKIFHDDDDDSL